MIYSTIDAVLAAPRRGLERESPLDETAVSSEWPLARVLIVSNRLPITMRSDQAGLTIHPSNGGLATGLRGLHSGTNALWIGWPGYACHHGASGVHENHEQFRRSRIVPVALDAREVRGYYEGVSNGALWPVLHDRLDRAPLESGDWGTYESVNERFADTVCAAYEDGDLIWVNDYQLLRLPALLRQRLPRATIGFFLHTPFPSADMFSTLPSRRSLLEGMLGADLIGFHTQPYAANFAGCLEKLLGAESWCPADGIVHVNERAVSFGVFPMGIDAARFAAEAASREVTVQTLELRAGGKRLLVGIDRLDYSKGIPRRLLAFEQFLVQHQEWRRRVQLVQVAVPSREGVTWYRRLRREVEAIVGRINGRFASPGWTPIQYLYRSVPQELLLALYRAADVMLVTPVRDGMNLVAKEFVASRVDGDGVLVLSEFAGAAQELGDAVIVNPYDIDGVAESIQMALTMPGAERRARMGRLRAHLRRTDVNWWAKRFLDAVARASARRQSGSAS